MADIDEAADAHDQIAKPADINVALCVDLREREKSQIETAAVMEIKLIGLIDHRHDILVAAGIAARNGRPANHALFIGQNNGIQQILFRRPPPAARRVA
ncbi:hypothetical protein [Sodalis glossinidius]|uniref:hypothetical protein n=1 Tax=Sodalis glossinidius TaxID=63612 RepID=UPI001FB44A6C|nr:hypothetical protein [Sodalis glossinidius]